MKQIGSNDTHVEVTFADIVQGKSRDGVISFRRPARYHFRTKRDDGEYKVNLEIYAAPIREGRTRAFFVSPAPGFIPTWLSHAGSNRFLNTDIWLHDAERVLRSDERGDKRYVTPTSSDVGANAWRQFWRRSGMAESPEHAFGPAALAHLDRLDRGTAIDPWTTHSKQCASCRKALKRATRLQKIGTAIACSAVFPASRLATAGLLFAGLATRAAASWAQRVIRGEVDPSRIMDRSVSAAATESDKKSGKTGLKEP